MQKVELYFDVVEAKFDMQDHIKKGWLVHICTMYQKRVLVVYEKNPVAYSTSEEIRR